MLRAIWPMFGIASVAALSCNSSVAEDSDASTASSARTDTSSALIEAVERATSRVMGRFSPTEHHQSTIVQLPERASHGLRIRAPDGPLSIVATVANATSAMNVSPGGMAVFPDALEGGGAWLARTTAYGAEDYAVFSEGSLPSQLEYRVALHAVAGLRLVDETLEFLDVSGTPQLRMRAPWVSGAKVVRTTTLEVEGCAVDRDPRGPWDRPVTAPGADECTVRIHWDPRGLVAPLVVDPTWTSTVGNLATQRYDHFAVKLANGRVMVGGGYSGSAAPDSVELFDPATQTWAATGALTEPRDWDPTAVLLDSGLVLLAGGAVNAVLQSAELYDPSTGTWAPTTPMGYARYQHSAVRLLDGRVLLAGANLTGEAEVYDPADESWTPTLPMAQYRRENSADLLPDGRVLLAGGECFGAFANTSETYDPSTNAWTQQTSQLLENHCRHGSVTLPDGRILIAGGWDNVGFPLPTVEVFDSTSDTWTPVSPLFAERDMPLVQPLSNGGVVVAGGDAFFTGLEETTEIFHVDSNTWLPGPTMQVPRYEATATALDDGRILAVGGLGYEVLADTELFTLAASGTECSAPNGCANAFCVDGLCCESACDGPCEACSAALTGGEDGVCSPIPSGDDPNEDCDPIDPSTCGTSGTCDGAGQCAVYVEGTECALPTCFDSAVTLSVCNGNGTCTQDVESCGLYQCSSASTCGAACESDDDCVDDGWCDSGQCAADLSDGMACERDDQCEGERCAGGLCVNGAFCADETTLLSPDRTLTDCAPYACEGGACLVGCSSVLDCAAGNICRAGGECAPPVAASTSEDGCSVARAAGREGRGAVASFFLAALLAVGVRRRRRSPVTATPIRFSR